ncbi:hypothetical protein JTY60_02475 [symbiont of Argiope bruennichi]|uniref:methionyl-tRNA formyltransferase n=1 Tax=symbiont of Argiope bruennichi TaxID=2810479 RepID=UPI003DA4E335
MNNFAFFGSDDLSFESLKNLVLSKSVALKLVVVKNKQKNLLKDPIFLFCQKNKIFFLNFEKNKTFWNDILKIFKEKSITSIFCCSFGAIFPLKVINFVKDTFNLHPSFLPRWKGPSPIVYSIRHDPISAVCIIKIAKEVDSGDIIKMEPFLIDIKDNYLSVLSKIKEIVHKNLSKWINEYYQNNFSLIKQDKSKETISKMITFSKRKINFEKNVLDVYNFIRSFPKSDLPYFCFKNNLFFIDECNFFETKETILPKTIILSKNQLKIYCLNGFINILKIQKEGKKILNIKSFLNGKLIFKNYDQTQ